MLTTTDTMRAAGGTLRFTAVAVDSQGTAVEGVPIRWTVSNAQRGRITPSGLFTAGPDSGRVYVRAEAGDSGPVDSLAVHVMMPGTVRWTWAASEVGGFMPLLGGPALGRDGTVFLLVGTGYGPDHPGVLVALSPDGGVRWTLPLLQVEGSTGPVVLPSDDVLLASVIVYLIAPTGAIQWDTLVAPPPPCPPCDELPVIPSFLSGAGTTDLFVAAAGKRVLAFSLASRTLRWASQESQRVSWLVPPTITSGGDVLAKLTDDTLFQFAGADGQIVKFFLDPDTGVDLRVFGRGSVPLGSRYYLPTQGRLAALDTTGPLLWLTEDTGNGVTEPAVGPDGTLFIQNRLWGIQALNPDGTTKWFRRTPNANMGWREQPRWSWHGGPALAEGGIVYAAGQVGFFALDVAGGFLWEFVADSAGAAQAFVGSPVIAPDGTVYTYTATHVYAFWASAPPEPNSPWPMWRHDAQRTGWARP